VYGLPLWSEKTTSEGSGEEGVGNNDDDDEEDELTGAAAAASPNNSNNVNNSNTSSSSPLFTPQPPLVVFSEWVYEKEALELVGNGGEGEGGSNKGPKQGNKVHECLRRDPEVQVIVIGGGGGGVFDCC
jgi:hypothetical protein